MKKIILILLITLIAFPSCKEKTENSNEDVIATYYLIRHAEKDRGDKINKDPHLIQVGRQRAKAWQKHFKDIKFDDVYSTDYNRTKETALPTAKANNLIIQLYDPFAIDMKAFMEKTKGKTVLIVGHSNTTPKFVNDLIGEEKYDDIQDFNNANLYKVVVTKEGVTSELSVVN
ncbi:MAG: histidine phosphatase family protein [Winogradskyella sp.]|uniref:SixA phosphatase family protein n=1 Tax=Winogradskyella sp. TaxID=1883156 RepID=UPI00385F1504